MAAAAIFSQLSDRFAKFVCGVSSPTTPPPDDDDDDGRSHSSELRSFLLLPPSSPERRPRGSSSSSPSASMKTEQAPVHDGDNDANVTASASPAEVSTEHRGHDDEEENEPATLPCLAFASEHGYRVFSLAHMRMLGVRAMPPVPGRRLVASPRGGTVLATDVCYRHPCHLADPFTGSRVPLPDLPIPFSEKEPVECRRDEPPRPHHHQRCARATDDGLAWDWSPRGVMVARGDTAFFCEHGGERWEAVHQSRLGSPMTVNYRAGLFFVLELRTLETTVIDADARRGTPLRARARIPAPPGLDLGDVDAAYLAPLADDAILLVHRRAGDSRRALFTEAYRARHEGSGSRRPPRWKPVVDIGDRAVFVDGAHGFTVTALPAGAVANRVYVILAHRVTHPCGRLAVAYDVGFSDITRPERVGRLKLNAGEVERMWGQPHWIIPRDGGSDRRVN